MDKEAKRAYDRAYHAARSPEAKIRKQRLQKERSHKIILKIRKVKASIGCIDCGESDPIVLDFNHRDRSKKKLQIGDCARLGWSFETIMKEAEKCDVICSNCHRKRTAKQLGWFE